MLIELVPTMTQPIVVQTTTVVALMHSPVDMRFSKRRHQVNALDTARSSSAFSCVRGPSNPATNTRVQSKGSSRDSGLCNEGGDHLAMPRGPAAVGPH